MNLNINTSPAALYSLLDIKGLGTLKQASRNVVAMRESPAAGAHDVTHNQTVICLRDVTLSMHSRRTPLLLDQSGGGTSTRNLKLPTDIRKLSFPPTR